MDELEGILATIENDEHRAVVEHLWAERDHYVRWPDRAGRLFACVRQPYHVLPSELKEQARRANVAIDTRSNGPAVMAFLLAGGDRPLRSSGCGWNIHHIYDGRHPWPGRTTPSMHAVKHEDHFTEAAGLVAVHPLMDAAADEYAWIAWQLRREAYERFGYDPDGVFGSIG